ncbi:MAG: efflux RND transporter periplasmic adaptor subunit [Spirochaetota bacterium]
MRRSSILLTTIMLISMFMNGCGDKSTQKETVLKTVEVKPVTTMRFPDIYTVAGEVRAVDSAYVSPEVPGVIREIFVKEGDRVTAEVTALFITSRETLEKNLKNAKQNLVLAELSVEESEANLLRLKAQFDKAENDLKRHEELYKKQAISESAYDAVLTAFRSADAMLKHGRTLLQLAHGKKDQAEIALSLAQQSYDDALVKSPIDGVVTEKMKEVGEMGSPGVPVVKLVDDHELEVRGYLPAKYFSDIEEGSTTVTIDYCGKSLGEYTVSYRSSVIDPVTRTFEIRCEVLSDNDYMVHGNMVNMNILFSDEKGLSVPVESVIRKDGKDVILTVHDNQVASVPVKTGITYNGSIMVNADQDIIGEHVIYRGQLLVKEGEKVNVREGE